MNIYLENAPAATEQEGPMAPAPTTLDEWLGAIYDEESMAPADGPRPNLTLMAADRLLRRLSRLEEEQAQRAAEVAAEVRRLEEWLAGEAQRTEAREEDDGIA